MEVSDYIEPGKSLAESAVWADVEPLASRGDEGVVAIRHTDRDREILVYFYAITASGEKSLRALALTEAVRPFCPTPPDSSFPPDSTDLLQEYLLISCQ